MQCTYFSYLQVSKCPSRMQSQPHRRESLKTSKGGIFVRRKLLTRTRQSMPTNFVALNGIWVPFGIGSYGFECGLVFEGKFKCHALDQAVCLRPFTCAIPGQSMWICGGKCGTGTGFTRSTSTFTCHCPSTYAPCSVIRLITDTILATDSVAKLHFEKGTFKVTDIHICS